MKTRLLIILAVGVVAAVAQDVKPLYQNNFESAEVDKVPEEFLVLEGGFAVKQDGTNKCFELPGAPLETYGALFGPTETTNVRVSARIHGTGKGRRYPTFGVGLSGVGGYRLQVSPAKKLLELYRGDEMVASAPLTWESDSWTTLHLQVRKVKEGEWLAEGRAFKYGTPEPATWSISHADTSEPIAGRASIWGSPYAGTPIRFDDFVVARAAAK